MAASRRKATARKHVETQTEVSCTRKRRAVAKKSVATQTEIPKQHASVQVAGCNECQSLALEVPGDGGNACVRCDQINDLLSLVACLREEVERLRAIKDCEKEIDWWCQALSAPRSQHATVAPYGACGLQSPCKQVTERNRQTDCAPDIVSPQSAPYPHNTYVELGGVGLGQNSLPKGQGDIHCSVAEPLPFCCRAEQSCLREKDGWKQIPTRRCGHPPPRSCSAPQVPLRNRFEALEPEGEVCAGVEGGPPVRVPRGKRSTPRLKTSSTRKDRRVVVIGDSLLQGTEGPICQPDPTRREVCCLPGARVRDIARRLPRLICPSDYYPLLIVQAGSEEVGKKSLKAIKDDFRRLGRVVEGTGVQVVITSVPSVAGNDTGMSLKTHLLNKWLRSWCKRRSFGFFDHGAIYSAPGMMAADGCSLSSRGKRVLAEELAGLIDRCLN